MMRNTCWPLVCAMAAIGGGGGAQAFTLIDQGKPVAKICVSADAPDEVREAADELARVLGEMGGRPFHVTTCAGADVIPRGPAILVDALAERAGLEMNETSRGKDGYRYKVEGQKLLVVAESPRGIFLGVHNFLERLGCGWYAPGSLGEVIPQQATVAVDEDLDCTGISDSIHRRYWYGGKRGVGEENALWLRRLNGDRRTGSWRHAWGSLVKKDLFDDHPEYFSLNLRHGELVRTTRQLCTTNPDATRTAADALLRQMGGSDGGDAIVYPAGPNDGGGLCECEHCRKLDTADYLEPSSGKPSCSDRTFKFAGDLAEITSRQFPDKDLGILVYSEYSRVPLKLGELHPNVFPMIAPIRRCRLHGPGNPNCVWGEIFANEIAGWADVSQGKLGFYIYNYNLADSLLPLGKISFYKDLQREINGLDIRELAWTLETIDSWAMHAPHMYLSVRLSWNSRIDIDRVMDRYFAGFYGEAAEPMRRYWLRIDEAYATTPACTGASYGQHRIWTPRLLSDSRADIEKAKRLAVSARVKEAVAMAEAGLRCAELFMQVWNGVGQFDFRSAAKAQEALGEHVAAMAAREGEPSWAHERYAFSQYFRRFIGRTVDGGAETLAGGGEIVARLPDVWKFAKDEEAVGTAQGWFRRDFDDRSWNDLATFSRSWSDQGLATFQGNGWYRTQFSVPADAKGKDLRLWFGGFDNNVDVYVNDRHLGEKTGFATPAEFEGVAEHLNFGQTNTIAVRVSAGGLSELGTGGIMMPAMIYKKGSAARTDAGEKEGDVEKPPAYKM